MSPAAVALTLIFGIVVVGVAIGLLAGVRRKMDLEQWTCGGRGFGLVLVWLLMAGEIFTLFTFLGASGWAYSRCRNTSVRPTATSWKCTRGMLTSSRTGLA